MSELRWVTEDGTAHERCRLMFLVGDNLVSEGEYDPGSAPDLGYRRGGVAYVCAYCGTVWAHAVVIDSSGRQMPFDVMQVSCEKHPDQWNVPGSLLGGIHNDGYRRLLSNLALRREFTLHHKWRQSANRSQSGS